MRPAPKIANVVQFTIDVFPNCKVTTAISASDPATTPSSTAAAIGDLLSRVIPVFTDPAGNRIEMIQRP